MLIMVVELVLLEVEVVPQIQCGAATMFAGGASGK